MADAEAPSAEWMDPPPEIVPGGNPVTALPGDTPRSPVTTVGPVLVTVEPASTAKDAADPRLTEAWVHTASIGTVPCEHTAQS